MASSFFSSLRALARVIGVPTKRGAVAAALMARRAAGPEMPPPFWRSSGRGPSAVTAAGDPFASLTWLSALQVVVSRCGADPARLAAGGEEELLALVRDAARGWGASRPDRRIARKVLAAADDPHAVGWSRRGLFRRVSDELGDLRRARRQMKEVEADMTALLESLGLARLGDVPGLSLVGAAVILAETGDPRRYETSSSMVKHAGLSQPFTLVRAVSRWLRGS